jgi:hypothetical protein
MIKTALLSNRSVEAFDVGASHGTPFFEPRWGNSLTGRFRPLLRLSAIEMDHPP